MKIIKEDNHLLIAYKEPGVLSQKAKEDDVSLNNMVKDYIKLKDNKPGNVYLALINRLDRPTSGLVLFGKTSKAAARLNKMIQTDKIDKYYLTVLHNNNLKDEDTLIDYLLKDEELNKSYKDKSGKKSILSYKVLETHNKLSLVEIKLITGRHHQIRVQMDENPVYSDYKYGLAESGELALIAYKLSFRHPVKDELVEISYIPNEYNKVFNEFQIFHEIKSKNV